MHEGEGRRRGAVQGLQGDVEGQGGVLREADAGQPPRVLDVQADEVGAPARVAPVVLDEEALEVAAGVLQGALPAGEVDEQLEGLDPEGPVAGLDAGGDPVRLLEEVDGLPASARLVQLPGQLDPGGVEDRRGGESQLTIQLDGGAEVRLGHGGIPAPRPEQAQVRELPDRLRAPGAADLPRGLEGLALRLDGGPQLTGVHQAEGEGRERVDADRVGRPERAADHPVEALGVGGPERVAGLGEVGGRPGGGEDLPEDQGLVLAGPEGLDRDRESEEDGGEDRDGGRSGDPVASEELESPIGERGWGGLDGPVRQHPLHVPRQGGDGLVAELPLGRERAADDALEVPAEQAPEVAGRRAAQARRVGGVAGRRPHPDAHRGRRLLHQEGPDVPRAHVLPQLVDGERRLADEELVEHHTEGVDVRAHVDVRAPGGLLGAHVDRGADDLPQLGEEGAGAELGAGGLRDAEVDDLRQGAALDLLDEDVVGLQVPVDDAALVRVVHRPAELEEHLEALADRQAAAVAEGGDRLARRQVHHEVGAASLRGARVQNPRDRGVLHEREGLPLRLEPRDDLPGVHPQLDHLHGDVAADGVRLVGLEHDAEAALAELLGQGVRVQGHAHRQVVLGGRQRGGRLEEVTGRFVGVEELPHLSGEVRVLPRGALEPAVPAGSGGLLEGGGEQPLLRGERPLGLLARRRPGGHRGASPSGPSGPSGLPPALSSR